MQAALSMPTRRGGQARPLPCLDFGELALARVDYPGLRTRHLDMRLILKDMLGQYLPADHCPDIRPAAWRALSAHDWPGNEAELRRLAMLMARQSPHKIYEAHDMRLLLQGRPAAARETMAETAKMHKVILFSPATRP